MNDREQFKEYADGESLINTTPNMGTIFDAYYRVGLGFKNEFDIVFKRQYPLPDYPQRFALKEICGKDVAFRYSISPVVMIQ